MFGYLECSQGYIESSWVLVLTDIDTNGGDTTMSPFLRVKYVDFIKVLK